jgi:transposase
MRCAEQCRLLEQLAMSLVCEPSYANGCLFGRSQTEDSPSLRTATHETKSEAARTFGVSLSSVKRYAKAVREGRSLSPGKAPGKKPLLDEKARKLLEAHVEERPFAKLSDRQEYLKKVAGVSVSESTLSRTLRKMGFGRKKGRWVPVSKTNS